VVTMVQVYTFWPVLALVQTSYKPARDQKERPEEVEDDDQRLCLSGGSVTTRKEDELMAVLMVNVKGSLLVLFSEPLKEAVVGFVGGLVGWRQDNRNRSNQESKFDFLATRQR